MLNFSRILMIFTLCFLCSLANTQEVATISRAEIAKSVIMILKKYKLGNDSRITADDSTLDATEKLYHIMSHLYVRDEFPRNAFIEILKSKSKAFSIARKESAHWWISAVNESEIMSNADLLALTLMSRWIESPAIVPFDVPLEEKTTREPK